MSVIISEKRDIPQSAIIELYEANQWSSARKPNELYQGLLNSHTLVSAWHEDLLVGIGNAISDGHLVVYYPHLVVHPHHQGKGVGKMIMERMREKYGGIHMQMLTADAEATGFYTKMGFVQAGKTIPMWIYEGDEH
ncbi:GNAT family N-acetyltransferase [Olivibacter sp. CPCC 100613]|uniref:GNAT family N-acetyltransferase n=1 Tax=Olivibacter sp. CPCC 100613 TaxID=3079931 RepID=UPI002FFCCB25